jgi:hypothetical protein
MPHMLMGADHMIRCKLLLVVLFQSSVAFFQRSGERCACQEMVACPIASMTSSMHSNRRPVKARLRSCFHHGSLRVSQQAYLGRNNSCPSGQANQAVCVSREIWVVRLSVITTHSRAG